MKKRINLAISIVLCALMHISLGQRITKPFTNSIDHWKIIVSKDHAIAYHDKNLLRPVRGVDLRFKETYFVVAYNGINRQIHAVRIEHEKGNFWVDANDLLLQNHAMKDGQISIKATVVNYIRTENPKSDYFARPDENGDKLGEARWYHIYFVYDIWPKIDLNGQEITDPKNAEYILLGIDSNIEYQTIEKNAKNTLLGWFKKEDSQNLVIWNTRVGLQPNLSTTSKQEKKQNATYGTIASTSNDAVRWSNNNSTVGAIISTDKNLVDNNYRFQFDDYRMLVLNQEYQKNRVIHEVAYAGSTIFHQNQFSRNTRKLRTKKTVNILYVIDATKTMDPYFKSLPAAINTANDYVEEKFESYEFNWGLAIFRNETDLAENRYQFLGSFEGASALQKQLENVYCFSNSSLLPEDLFWGTQRAMDDFFFPETEGIRVTMVISDVKSSESATASGRTLGTTARAKGSHLFSINVGNAYESEFKKQMLTVSQVMQTHQESFTTSNDPDNAINFNFVDLPDREDENVLQNFYIKVNNSDYYMDLITGILIQLVGNINLSYREKLYGITSQEDIDLTDSPIIKEDLKFKFPMNFSNDFKNYNLENDEVGIYYSRGYIVNEHINLEEPPFEPVLLLSTEDCYRIWKVSEEILKIIDNPDPGGNMTVLLRDLFNQYTGEEQLYKNVTQLHGIGRQLPAVSRFVSEFLTEGINFMKQMSPNELREFKAQIREKKARIRDTYQELVEQNGFPIGHEYYQWVKLSDIP